MSIEEILIVAGGILCFAFGFGSGMIFQLRIGIEDQLEENSCG